MLDRYRSALGITYLVVGVSTLLMALASPWILVAVGVLATDHDRDLTPLVGCASLVVASLLVMAAAPAVVAGAGLLCRQAWAPTSLTVAAVLLLCIPPVGTVVGGLTLWALWRDRGAGSR